MDFLKNFKLTGRNLAIIIGAIAVIGLCIGALISMAGSGGSAPQSAQVTGTPAVTGTPKPTNKPSSSEKENRDNTSDKKDKPSSNSADKPSAAAAGDLPDGSAEEEDTMEIIEIDEYADMAETTPAETKPSDTKPSDTKPADTKPSDTKPSDTKPSATDPDAPETPADPDTQRSEADDPVDNETSMYRDF